MNKLVFAALIAPLLVAGDELPKAETILDRFVDVTGGKAVMEKHHNEVMHGTIEFGGRGLKGTMTMYQAEPNLVRAIIDIEGVGKIESGSNGEVAWENSAMQGPRIKKDVEKADAFRDATFNAALKWKQNYSHVETTGVENVDGQECYKLVLTPPLGNPTTEFFDKKTGLLVKTTAKRTTAMGEIEAEVLPSDYRKEGDVIIPHKLLNKFAGQEFTISVESIEFNAEIPKDRFDLPPEIQALLKKQAAPAASSSAPVPGSASSDKGKFTVYMLGKPLATENYQIEKSAGKIEIDGSGTASLGTLKIDIEQFKIDTDDNFHPVDAVAKGKLGQVQMNVKTTFADGKATNEMDSGQGPQTKEHTVSPDALVVSANFPLFPWSLLALRADLTTKEPQKMPIYILGQAEVPGTVVFKGKETVEFAGKTAELNHLNVNGTPPDGQPISLDFWVDDNRKVIKISVPSRGVEGYQEGFDRKPPSETAKPAAQSK